MQKDRSQGLMRSNIFVKGTRVQTPAKSVGVAHVKGTTAGSKKMVKNQCQIPAEVALLQPISTPKIGSEGLKARGGVKRQSHVDARAGAT
ncbi:hypothetical protein PF005_g25809 [Phytophthora fragariae]|uniref:Uncharacterized protein n=1 Tax=Phytophthora fragariae TaxID=53985 RepID=A0A6A3VWG9_9STRA|nr:hypothetical protein PF009_g11853 [Phytophthora fragariae]KAE9174554.1 hypothetical protein PF005_g25809 [Phytophthora fragariae]KAE9295023.1 hypothetical protein PF008_g24380 [Phytophthora fragariae]